MHSARKSRQEARETGSRVSPEPEIVKIGLEFSGEGLFQIEARTSSCTQASNTVGLYTHMYHHVKKYMYIFIYMYIYIYIYIYMYVFV